jgi:hypothetical protein
MRALFQAARIWVGLQPNAKQMDVRKLLRRRALERLTQLPKLGDKKDSISDDYNTLKYFDAIDTWRVHPKPHISCIDAFCKALANNQIRWFQLEQVFRPKYEPIDPVRGVMGIMTEETKPDRLMVRWQSDSNFNGEGPTDHLFVFQNIDPEDTSRVPGGPENIIGTDGDANSLLITLLFTILFNPEKVEKINKRISTVTQPDNLTRFWQYLYNKIHKRTGAPTVLSLARDTTGTAKGVNLVTIANEAIKNINSIFRRFPIDSITWHPIPFPERITRARYIGTEHWSEFYLLGPEKHMARYTRYMMPTIEPEELEL